MQSLQRTELELILLQERGLINELLKQLRNKKQDEQFDEIDTLRRYRFRFFYDDIILSKLDDISKILKDQNFRCNYSQESDRLVKMLISPSIGEDDIQNGRQKGLKEIRDFTQNSNELIIIDPFIYSGSAENASKIIEEFKKSTRIDGNILKKIQIVYSSAKGVTHAIKNGIKALASTKKCTLIEKDTEIIHDRIWIKNKTEAIVVGTSFGGIGKKLCFILPLPKADLEDLMKYLLELGC